jgi:hypothetical protein
MLTAPTVVMSGGRIGFRRNPITVYSGVGGAQRSSKRPLDAALGLNVCAPRAPNRAMSGTAAPSIPALPAPRNGANCYRNDALRCQHGICQAVSEVGGPL